VPNCEQHYRYMINDTPSIPQFWRHSPRIPHNELFHILVFTNSPHSATCTSHYTWTPCKEAQQLSPFSAHIYYVLATLQFQLLWVWLKTVVWFLCATNVVSVLLACDAAMLPRSWESTFCPSGCLSICPSHTKNLPAIFYTIWQSSPSIFLSQIGWWTMCPSC